MTNSWWRYAACIGLLSGLTLGGTWLASHSWFETIRLSDYYHYQCDTVAVGEPAQVNKPRFHFLAVSSLYADKIAEQLCHSAAIAARYSGVTVSWKPRWLLSPSEVLNEEYDLIWSRENALRGLVPNYRDYYSLLLNFDNYSVSWFSKGTTPELSQDYFNDKRVGILQDTLSQTHHLLPLVSLKNANIQLAEGQLVTFDDASSLYAAFARGQVDLISGGEWLRAEIDAPLNSLFISDKVSAASLFLRKRHAADIECALIKAVTIYQKTLFSTHLQLNHGQHCAIG